MKDYYELLEVNKNASDDTIKKVFRMLIKKNHPDLFEGKEKQQAEEKVKLLNEAYAVLSDKEKREQYNLELEENNLNNDVTIETLIKENEYLKSVINEKNKLIKEYLDEIGIDSKSITNNFDVEYEEEIYNERQKQDDKIQHEAYQLYKNKEMIKKIAYIMLMIIIGIVIINITTGINMFEIFIQVFKNMF